VTDVVVDRLRILGDHGRRLAAVAAGLLPAALEQAFADVDDIRLDTLAVRLDATGVDDETLAVLWASAIRRAALEAGARVRPPGAPPARPGPPSPAASGDAWSGPRSTATGRAGPGPDLGPARPGAGTGALVGAVRAWLASGAQRRAVPRVLVQLADPRRAAEVCAAIGSAAAVRLRDALAGPVTARPPRPPAASSAGPARTHPAAPATSDGPGDAAAGAAAAADRAGTDRHVAAGVAAAAEALRAIGDDALADPDGTVDLARVTRVAGLVLLYPWLTDLCDEATGRDACADAVEAVAVRRRTLASLADPDDPTLVDDPLVLLLAGAGPAAHALPTPLPDPAAASAGDAVLHRFAGLLPGFERSSPGFVRTTWLRRRGLLVPTDDGAAERRAADPEAPIDLLAERAPLDVILRLLPYPLGLLRLPWSPPLSVRFVP
jgi:hypothetical protein